MIRINLLPARFINAAKTPFILFCTAIGGLALTGVSVAVYAYLWFNVIVIEERVDNKREEVIQLEKNALEVDSVLGDIADYRKREKAIINIKTNRVLWSKKLARLIEITPSQIWIVNCEMKELDPSDYKWEKNQQQTGGHLELTCYSQGDGVDRMTRFRQRLKSEADFYLNFLEEKIAPDSFYSDFINISHPEWRFVLLPLYREPKNIRFSVRLDLRPLAEKSSGDGKPAA